MTCNTSSFTCQDLDPREPLNLGRFGELQHTAFCGRAGLSGPCAWYVSVADIRTGTTCRLRGYSQVTSTLRLQSHRSAGFPSI